MIECTPSNKWGYFIFEARWLLCRFYFSVIKYDFLDVFVKYWYTILKYLPFFTLYFDSSLEMTESAKNMIVPIVRGNISKTIQIAININICGIHITVRSYSTPNFNYRWNGCRLCGYRIAYSRAVSLAFFKQTFTVH